MHDWVIAILGESGISPVKIRTKKKALSVESHVFLAILLCFGTIARVHNEGAKLIHGYFELANIKRSAEYYRMLC